MSKAIFKKMDTKKLILIEILYKAHNRCINRQKETFDFIGFAIYSDSMCFNKELTNKLLKNGYLKLGDKPDILILTDKVIGCLEEISKLLGDNNE